MELATRSVRYSFRSISTANNSSWLVYFRPFGADWQFRILRDGEKVNSGRIDTEPSRAMAVSLIRNYDNI